ncbi:hypothetical protein HD806DRAFT_538351 [Xylariaceae sp. AK1471]|nr:hypothetical protein HD806DRAFT_538351 [Xylariaceae sp. AK1471]
MAVKHVILTNVASGGGHVKTTLRQQGRISEVVPIVDAILLLSSAGFHPILLDWKNRELVFLEPLCPFFAASAAVSALRPRTNLTRKQDVTDRHLSCGQDNFPLLVGSTNGCASQLIDGQSLCQDEEELKGVIRRINKALYEVGIRRTEYLGIQYRKAYANACDPEGRNSDNIVIQEYIDDLDITCALI